MVEVEIRNFQSIEHLTVKIDGFTALAGRNNIGKSAVVRAVRAALTGAPADAYVRHGSLCMRIVKSQKSCKCFCSVHIRGEGLDLLWEKGDAKNSYHFNGTEYSAANRGTPDFLQALFGMVKLGREDNLIQIADQWRPMFLLDEPGSVVADVLSDVANLDQINVAIRLAEKDRRELGSQRKVREKDVADLKLRVEGFNGLDDVLARARQAELAKDAVEAVRQRRNQVVAFRDDILALAKHVQALSKVSALTIPDVAPVAAKGLAYTQLTNFLVETESREKAISSLQAVETIVPPAIQAVKTGQGAFERLHGWVMKFRGFKESFDRLKKVGDAPVTDISGILSASDKAVRLLTLHRKHRAAEETLAALELADAENEANAIAVKADSDSLGVCPTCTRPVCGELHETAAAE